MLGCVRPSSMDKLVKHSSIHVSWVFMCDYPCCLIYQRHFSAALCGGNEKMISYDMSCYKYLTCDQLLSSPACCELCFTSR